MASVETTEMRKRQVRKILDDAGLDWFRCEPGFRFLDHSGDECIVIGWGGWRKTQDLGSLALYPSEQRGIRGMNTIIYGVQTQPATLVGAYCYKGEQHLCSIPDLEFLSECQPYRELEEGKCHNE